jgi:hypothetical protein
MGNRKGVKPEKRGKGGFQKAVSSTMEYSG